MSDHSLEHDVKACSHPHQCAYLETGCVQAACTAMGSTNSGLLDTSVAPAAADAAASMLDSATEDRKRVRKYLARLKEVRRSWIDPLGSFEKRCG